MKASDIMTRALVTLTPDMTLEDCLRLMDQNTSFHLIVLDLKQGFRRMLSISDILRVVASDEEAGAICSKRLFFRSVRTTGFDDFLAKSASLFIGLAGENTFQSWEIVLLTILHTVGWNYRLVLEHFRPVRIST
jgi:hypothetical protein